MDHDCQLEAFILSVYIQYIYCTHVYDVRAHYNRVWKRFLRIMNNLNELKDPERLSHYKNMAEISKNVCSKNGPVQGGPLSM